jgi:hypothetical protein
MVAKVCTASVAVSGQSGIERSWLRVDGVGEEEGVRSGTG